MFHHKHQILRDSMNAPNLRAKTETMSMVFGVRKGWVELNRKGFALVIWPREYQK
jgi:hypothetical protein